MLDSKALGIYRSYPRQKQIDRLSVLIHESPAAMAKNAAIFVNNYLQQCLSDRGTASIILATGNSQILFLERLIELGTIDWSKITCFHLDEFLGISPTHPGSFQRYLRERFADKVTLKAFHYLQGDSLEPIAECDRYTQLLQSQPIDLCCLGIGENGHIAFNEPEVASFKEPRWVKIVKLTETTIKQQINGVAFSSIESVPQYAYTLTIPAICHSLKIVTLAAGKSKSAAIRALLGSPTESIPATILSSQEQASLFLDEEAANWALST